MTWQMRKANQHDLESIMAIESAVFLTDAWSEATMSAELASPLGYYLVAFPPGSPEQIDGYAGLFAPVGAEHADIQTIAVAETARRRGLGRALVRILVAEARSRGASELFLDVRTDNPSAQNLYRDLGFEQIAVRKAYYRPDGVDAIVMRLQIPEARVEPA